MKNLLWFTLGSVAGFVLCLAILGVNGKKLHWYTVHQAGTYVLAVDRFTAENKLILGPATAWASTYAPEEFANACASASGTNWMTHQKFDKIYGTSTTNGTAADCGYSK